MGDSKSIFTSVTFWGLVLGVAAPLLAAHGIKIPGDDAGLANDVATAVGAAISIWGRIRATQQVHVIAPVNTLLS